MLLVFILLLYCKASNSECKFHQTINIYDNSSISFDQYENVDILLSFDTSSLTECDKLQFYEDNNLIEYWIENKCGLKDTLLWIHLSNFYKNKEIEMVYDCENNLVTEKQFDGDIYFFTENTNLVLQLFDGNFLFGSEVFGNVYDQDGIDSHDHIISGLSCTSDRTKANILESNKKFPTYQHSHSWNFYSETSNSNLPPFYEINLLSRKKLFINYIDKPIIMFTNLNNDKFSRFIALDDRFPKIGINKQVGGRPSHFHYINGQLETSSSPTISGDNNGEICSLKQFHSHNVIGQTETSSNYPPFISVLFGKYKDEKKNVKVDESMIFIASRVPPLGYELCSDFLGRFPKGSDIYGIKGGSFSHYHAYKNVSIEPDIGSYQGCVTGSSSLIVSINNHTHIGFEGNSSIVHSNPSYIEVLFIKRKEYQIKNYCVVFGDPITDNDHDTSITPTYATNSFNIVYLLVIVVSSIILFLVCTLIVMVSIALLFCYKLIKMEKTDQKHLELKEEEEDEPKFEINKDLFKINAMDVKLIEELGRGGSTSVVYKSRWKGILVAYKVFKRQTILNNKNDCADFEKEINIMSSTSHPSIAIFYGCVISKTRLGIVMEYFENFDLATYVNKSNIFPHKFRQLTIQNKLRILIEITLGGEYLHQRNIIHRDLKCANVLLDCNLRSKIIDFGISKIVSSKEEKEKKTRAIGTRHYMAPEVILGTKYDSSCDVYSFSIIMYELITECFKPYEGSLKHKDGSNIDVYVASDPKFRPIIEEEYFEKFGLGWCVELIKTCWDHRPSKRPPFSEIVKILKAERKCFVNRRNKRRKSSLI
jgi:tRNA A-37 threonylcarbamoyl transferase component Bud32